MFKLLLRWTFFATWLVILSVACSPTQEAGQGREPLDQPSPVSEELPVAQGEPYARLETGRGRILIRLLPELAPAAVENFIELGEGGFYSRTMFHRVLPRKMIQGGDPNSKDNDPYNDGRGNSGKFLPAEFSSHHLTRGTVAMARQPGDPNSSSSQFFIVLERSPEWDGQYTVFGEVVEGIEVAEEISRAPLSKDPRLRNRPAVSIRIQRVFIEYR